MGPLLLVAICAACAAAQSTITVWKIPVQWDHELNTTDVGSVIGVSGDRTTLQLRSTIDTKTTLVPFTLGGLTYMEYTLTPGTDDKAKEITIMFTCSRANERVTDANCTILSTGPGIEDSWQSVCGDYSRSEVHTTTLTRFIPSYLDRPASTFIITRTNDYRSDMPEYCTNSTLLSEMAKDPVVAMVEMVTAPVVLTAGLEKLSASAAATPVGSVASVTGLSSGVTPTQTGSAAGSTGAAAPTNFPALAGVGAVAVAFFL
jgi:hypothetical protein